MSYRDQWTAFRDERTGSLWRRYQWFSVFKIFIPIYDEEYDRYKWVETTTMNDPAYRRVFLNVGNKDLNR